MEKKTEYFFGKYALFALYSCKENRFFRNKPMLNNGRKKINENIFFNVGNNNNLLWFVTKFNMRKNISQDNFLWKTVE